MPPGLTFNVYGNDVSAGKVLKGVETQGAKTAKDTSESFKKMAGVIGGAFAADKAIDFFKDSISAASDLSESTSKVGVVFGQQAAQIEKASKTSAGAMGLSSQAYLEATGTLGNLLVSLDVAPKKAADMSQQMVKLAGDLASFNNVSPEEALAAIKSGLTGETEPLKAFGVNMNDATLHAEALKLGLIKNIKDGLDPQAKALAAQSLIMSQTTTAQGDFARTSGGLANQQRILAARFEDVKAKVGAELLPIMTQTVSILSNDVIPAFTATASWVKKNKDVIGPLAATVVGLWVAWKAYTVVKTAGTAISGAVKTIAADMKNMRTQATTSGSALRTGAGIGGAAMLGLGAIVVGVTMKQKEHARQVALNAAAIDSYTQAIKDDSGALDDNVRAVAAKALADQDAFGNARKMGIDQRTLTNAVLGNAHAVSTVKGAIADYTQQNGYSKDAVFRLSTALNEQGVILDASQTKAKDLAAATDKGSTAQTKSVPPIKKTTTALEDQQAAADKLIASLKSLSGNKIDAAQAELRFKDGLAQATQQVKDNGSSLSENTVKGRSNREWLLDQLSALSDVAQAQLDAGQSTDTVTAKLRANEKQLRDAATAAGLNKDQVNALVRAFGRLPVKKAVPISLPGVQQSLEALASLRAALKDPTLGASVSATGITHLKGGGGYAQGTGFSAGGEMTVGELGKERVTLPPGSVVTSATATASQDRMRNGTREKTTVVHNYNTVTIHQYGLPGTVSTALPFALRSASADLGGRG